MANASPTVSITSPSSGEQFKVGETVSIAAAAADSDG
ncbi:Ig-like domain-containing protein, partial [Algoriphagus aestuariicola]